MPLPDRAEDCANIHRAVHTLSQRATERFERVRSTVASFLGAKDEREVVFVRGATEALNLVAQSYARPSLKPGDEVLITEIEHHANLVPWQMVCEQTGARLSVVPVQDNGEVLLEDVVVRMNDATKIVAFPHVSNALGTVLPAAEICGGRRAASRVWSMGRRAWFTHRLMFRLWAATSMCLVDISSTTLGLGLWGEPIARRDAPAGWWGYDPDRQL